MGKGDLEYGTTTTQQTIDPRLLTASNSVLNRAQYGYNFGRPQYFQDPTVAGFSDATQQGLAGMKQLAAGGLGEPATVGLENLAETLRGKYLDPASNPYLASTFRRGANEVALDVGSRFGGAGRVNSGGIRAAQAAGSANVADQIYGGNYQAERGRQFQALGLLPQAEQMRDVGNNRLLAAGALEQDQRQSEITADKARWDFNQNSEINALERFANLLAMSPLNKGGVTVQTGPIGKTEDNTAGNVLGGVGAVAALAALL